MHVVSVPAHQDDEMQCLGTLLTCRARGDTIALVTLTEGARGLVPMRGRGAVKSPHVLP